MFVDTNIRHEWVKDPFINTTTMIPFKIKQMLHHGVDYISGKLIKDMSEDGFVPTDFFDSKEDMSDSTKDIPRNLSDAEDFPDLGHGLDLELSLKELNKTVNVNYSMKNHGNERNFEYEPQISKKSYGDNFSFKKNDQLNNSVNLTKQEITKIDNNKPENKSVSKINKKQRNSVKEKIFYDDKNNKKKQAKQMSMANKGLKEFLLNDDNNNIIHVNLLNNVKPYYEKKNKLKHIERKPRNDTREYLRDPTNLDDELKFFTNDSIVFDNIYKTTFPYTNMTFHSKHFMDKDSSKSYVDSLSFPNQEYRHEQLNDVNNSNRQKGNVSELKYQDVRKVHSPKNIYVADQWDYTSRNYHTEPKNMSNDMFLKAKSNHMSNIKRTILEPIYVDRDTSNKTSVVENADEIMNNGIHLLSPNKVMHHSVSDNYKKDIPPASSPSSNVYEQAFRRSRRNLVVDKMSPITAKNYPKEEGMKSEYHIKNNDITLNRQIKNV